MVATSLSPLLDTLAPSATLAFMDRARDMARAGLDIVSLAGGEPDVPPSSLVRASGIQRLEQGHLSYGPVAGLTDLREEIALKLSNSHGCDYEASQIVVANGAKQVLFEALFAASAPGDQVIIPAPYWVSYPAMAILAGAKPQIVSTSAATGHKLTADQLQAVLKPESRWLILNSPSNPTGAVYSREELQSLAEVIRSHPRLLVLSDDIYEDIIYCDAGHVPLVVAAPDLADRTVTCSGFSKGQAMTGLRVGYASGPQWLISAMIKLQSHVTSGGCVVGQGAAVTALRQGGAFMSERLKVYAGRRELLLRILEDAPRIAIRPPDGAF
jgi:aspartate aminotransferase